jgi:PAS domain S-box-containing protein
MSTELSIREHAALRIHRGAAVAVVALGLFLAVYLARDLTADPRVGLSFLYLFPVVLLALRYGAIGGTAGTLLAVILTLVGDSGHAHLPLSGYITRFVVLAGVAALVSWFVGRERRMRRLREEAQQKVRRFFELSQDMLCTADTQGYFVDLNPAWEKTLGYTEEELRSKPFVEMVHPDDRERTAKEAAAIFKGEDTVNFENRYLAKDASVRWLSWNSVLGPDGLIYARATDITARRRADDELQELAAALKRSNDELGQFAYIASHDLGEPLRTIAGFAQLLEKRYEDQVDERGRDYIARMVGGVYRMQQMISDLLAFSRAGKEEIDRVPVQSSKMVEEIVQSLEQAVSETGTEIRVAELPEVAADRNQLIQVFQNLLSNAIKFNDSDHPRVEIGGVIENGGWRFSVADNGIGIDPEKRERIFAAFHRLHSRDEYPGSGIGLAICNKIVERHGGQMTVGNGLDGRGSTFTFTIAGK